MTTTNVQRTRGEIIWFGIGSFHFGYRKAPPFKFRLHEYVRDLKSALESVPAITEVFIDIPETKFNIDNVDVHHDPGLFQDGVGHFPPISHGSIRFQIYIPARVQEDLCQVSAPTDTGTERFTVYIDYAYEGPVAFVTLQDPASGDRDPATAIQVVREFLVRELRPNKSPIRFEFLGPSPFHAECSLRLIDAAAAGNGAFAVSHIERRGYDLLRFTSDHIEYDSAEDAAEDLFQELDEELGLFYAINANEAQARIQWQSIEEQVNALAAEPTGGGPWRNVIAKFKRSRRLAEVFS
jgi:hypothetical protein